MIKTFGLGGRWRQAEVALVSAAELTCRSPILIPRRRERKERGRNSLAPEIMAYMFGLWKTPDCLLARKISI
jgi:hypothetical protein